MTPWILFFVATATAALCLFLPGSLILRALGINWGDSLCLSPLLMIFIYQIEAIVYSYLSIRASWGTMFIPSLIIGILLIALRLYFKKSNDGIVANSPQNLTGQKWFYPILYVLAACLVSIFFFLRPLDGPSSFSQGPDNAAHLSYIESMARSGNFSPLEASFYHDVEIPEQNPYGDVDGAFYPTGWHSLGAQIVSLLDCDAPLAANATLFIFISLVFPLGSYLLLKQLSNDSSRVLICGAFCTLAFEAFPWRFLIFGPLYPNLVAFALVPLAEVLFIRIFESKRAISSRILYSTLFLAGLVCLALVQPNSVFTCGVLLLPYCVQLIWKKVSHIHGANKSFIQIVAVSLFLVMCAYVWVRVHGLNFMKGVVGYPWPPFGSIRQEIINILLLSYKDTPIQPVLALLVLSGLIGLAIGRKGFLKWPVASYLICCLLCIAAATTSDDLRSMLIGFWYTDSYRIAAMAALAAIPIAAFGLSFIFDFLCSLFDMIRGLGLIYCGNSKVIAGIILLIAFFTIFYPSFSLNGVGFVTTAFGVIEQEWYSSNHNMDVAPLDYEEMIFLKEVQAVVGPQDLILNKPDDGSCFGYGSHGLNLFYRRTGIDAYDTDSPESKLIRNNLNELSWNPELRSAVDSVDAKYLLILDQGEEDSKNRYWYDHYYPEKWRGIDAVGDTTPGFKLVLKEGDMRLYELI